MAVFGGNANNTPIGVLLIRKGLIKETDIDRAIEYQKEHKGVKLRRSLSHIKSLWWPSFIKYNKRINRI